jgi:hypothetical protein
MGLFDAVFGIGEDIVDSVFGSGTGASIGNFVTSTFGGIDPQALTALLGTAAYQSGGFDKVLDAIGLDFLTTDANAPPVTGYQGGIPEYVAVQERVPQAAIAAPRPGAAGQRYFSDVVYAQKPESMRTPPTLEQARAMARSQVGLGSLNAGGVGSGMAGTLGGPGYGEYPLGSAGPRVPPSSPNYVPPPRASGGSGVGTGPITDETFYGNPSERPQLRAAGGLLGLAKGGYYLGGTTDGMADKVPARIDGRQEARLSDGEFVVPADVVSHLGNGNSNAGAQQLYAMMDKVRQDRTGRKAQGKQINPKRYMPGMGA